MSQRQGDLTKHICSDCLSPIEGPEVVRFIRGVKAYFHAGRCDKTSRETVYDKVSYNLGPEDELHDA